MADAKYPKWKYHVEYESVIVNSPDDEQKLGASWKDSPADCGKPDSAPAVELIRPKAKAKK